MELLYGRRPVYETLRAGRRRLQRLLLADGFRPDPLVESLQELALAQSVPIRRMPRTAFEASLGDVHHQGVALEASPYPYAEPDAIAARTAQRQEPPFLLLLDHLQDPQNLGAILRSAEAAGVHGVLLPDRRAAAITPAAVRASAGASEHLLVHRVVNLVRAMNEYKEQGIWLAGLDAGADSQPYLEADLSGPIGLVIGSEGDGLGRLVGETCDFRIRLPMRGQVDSLNAGAAAAVALYEVCRRRTALPPRPTRQE